MTISHYMVAASAVSLGIVRFNGHSPDVLFWFMVFIIPLLGEITYDQYLLNSKCGNPFRYASIKSAVKLQLKRAQPALTILKASSPFSVFLLLDSQLEFLVVFGGISLFAMIQSTIILLV